MLEKRREEKLAKKKYFKKSAVFENEDRWKSLQRDMEGKNKLGPGQYKLEQTEIKKKKKKKKKGNNIEGDDLIIPKLESVLEMIREDPILNPE